LAYDFGAAKRRVSGWVGQGFYPGAGLVLGRGELLLLEQYFGDFGGETEVFIASAGKWLATAAIAAVVDQGLLAWEDRIGRWLPEFKADSGNIQLRQLLSHTSGVAEQHPPEQHPDDYQTLEESVAQIVSLPLRDRPGERFRYGGLALQVAGRMAELAAGLRFEELFQRCIARPLALEHTRFTPVDSAPGHNPMLSGGARSTTRDYARFLAMLAGGGRFAGRQVLSAAVVEEMQGDQVGPAMLSPGEFVERARGATHTGVYGLGLWRERLDAEGRAVHISSPSWAGTYPWIDSERNVYGVLVAHVDLNGPPWEGGFNPLYASAGIAELVAAAIDR
jgi:CubicO group peptidase (beta-lactamase class C family)